MDSIKKELDAHQQQLLAAFMRREALQKQLDEVNATIRNEQSIFVSLQFAINELSKEQPKS